VLHQIGVGALGPVFRTYEPTRDRLVAVKVFRLDITPEQAAALADELTRATEGGLFHPSIVEPVAAGLEGTVAFRAEEYVAAESLDVAMRHYAPAATDKVLPFITQLASAIDFARAAGVGHGALHPRDIFVTPDEARATGFGVVDALDRLGLRAPVRRPYSPPERIAGEPWGTPADVFSLGVIAFELLTGRRPAGVGEQMGSLAGASLGDRGDAIRAVLARAMHETPAERYSTAGAFADALREAAGIEATAAASEPARGAIGDRFTTDRREPAAEPAVANLSETPTIVESATEQAEAHALEDFAAEPVPPSVTDSPREVARKVIAARKRQIKPKPDATPILAPLADAPGEPAAAAPVTPPVVVARDRESDDRVFPEQVSLDRRSADAIASAGPAAADVPEAVAPEAPPVPPMIATPAAATPAEAAARVGEPEIARDAPPVPPLVAADELSPVDASPLATEPAAREPALAAHALAPDPIETRLFEPPPTLGLRDVSLVPPSIDEPAEPLPVDSPLLRDATDRVVAVDEFRAREATASRADRARLRGSERSDAERAFASKPSPIDPIEPEIPALAIDEPRPERSRFVMLPLAIGLMIGLLLGYAGGYFVASRDQTPQTAENVRPPTTRSETPGTTGQTPPAAPKDFSEQAVGRSTAPPAVTPGSARPPAPAATKTPSAAAPKTAAPAPRAGRIVITSDPSRAAVTVNGVWSGRTPLTLDNRSFGKYVVRIVSPGFEVARHELQLSSEQPTRTVEATLRRTERPAPAPKPAAPASATKPQTPAARDKPAASGPGEIYVDSRPQGARVLIDGKDVGMTPLRLTGQAAGPRSVRIELADHQPWTTTTRVVPGEIVRVTGSLERIR
jgi:eukaryotic-like serine/threonine-protein kinase